LILPLWSDVMIRVTVVLLEGGVPSTSITPIEIFGAAGVLWNSIVGEDGEPLFRVRTVSLDGKAVRSAASIVLEPDCSIAETERPDLVFVPAIRADTVSARENAAASWPWLAANEALVPWLKRWHRRGTTVAGVCTGVALLAEAGLLDDRPATTHWAFGGVCEQRYPRVRWQIERLITDSGNVVCGGGVYASIDLSLYLVEKFCGHRIAMQTAKALLLETPRMWQAGYAADPPQASHGDTQIQQAQEWLVRNLGETLRVEELASRTGMSPRTFARRFKAATGDTPINYLHRVRVNAAKHLLESEPRSVRQVSREVGYEDVTFFRRLFKRYTGAPPREYRERFGTGAASIRSP
jgi:transcriptional regulator GlxA family with amidase domain